MALAGIALDLLDDSLWYASIIALGITMIGTLTSLLIPRTQPPNPDLRMPLGMVFVPHETWRFIFSQPALRNCLIMVVLFWFIGGVTQPAVNSLGELVFHLSKTRTSRLAASIGVGIALGCLVAGTLNKKHANGSTWVRTGAWMMVLVLLLITLLSSGVLGSPRLSSDQESVVVGILQADLFE